MNIGELIRFTGFALIFSAVPFPAAAEDFSNALRAFLQQRVEVEKRDVAMVIGIVDQHGSRVVGCGNMDNGTGREVDGNTLFEIGSITKTFTTLLLEDLIERGEMKLNDPVAKYLPASVKMPTRNGKEITLLHLATHTSGLPLLPDNLNPERADNPYANYTVGKLNDFLSDYELTHDPGAKFTYSEVGMELLGHVIALKAGTNYEALVVDRICRPLKMDSTRITMTPELKARTATGHDELGHAVPGLTFQTLVSGSGLRSTANDLLKYLSAQLGLTPSSLTPLMERTHEVRFQSAMQGVRMGLAWAVAYYPQGREVVMHGGATPGCTTFVATDKTRRRGVVVLASSNDPTDVSWIGRMLLEREWQPDRRPEAATIRRLDHGSYAGEYRLSPDLALGMLVMRLFLVNVPRAAIGIAAGACLGMVFLLILLGRIACFRRLRGWPVRRWRAFSIRKRRLLLGGAVPVGVFLAVLTPLVAAHVACALTHPVVTICGDGERLFVQCTGSSHVPGKFLLPHITGELLPESETRLFERLSGISIAFSRDARGKVSDLTAPLLGAGLSFVRISEQVPEPRFPRGEIKPDTTLADDCAGQYEFAADDMFPHGIKLTLQRRGNRWIGRASGKNGSWGAFDVYPESETNCFFTMTVVGVQLTFVRNHQSQVTSVIRHMPWLPDREAKKLAAPAN